MWPRPAHVEAVDFDGDGDLDLVVAALGVLFPEQQSRRLGDRARKRRPASSFTSHYVADRIARVADASAGDLDGDGDLDLAVAGFGYDDGETSWLENQGGWKFEQHVLQRLSGPINAICRHQRRRPSGHRRAGQPGVGGDLGVRQRRPRHAYAADDLGLDQRGLRIELDDDGRHAIATAIPTSSTATATRSITRRPTAGRGRACSGSRTAATCSSSSIAWPILPGASSPQAADLDGDGDLDVVVVSANNDWDDPAAPSLVWLENDGRMQFTMHPIASSPTHLITLAVGDLDGDGKPISSPAACTSAGPTIGWDASRRGLGSLSGLRTTGYRLRAL